MKTPVIALAATASVALTLTSFADIASAVPMANALAMKNDVPPLVETVRWGGGWGGRGWGWGGRGWGWGVGAGLLAGAVVGGALAAPYYGYGYPYPYYGYGYPYPYYGYYGYPRYGYYGYPRYGYYRPWGWRRWY